MKHDQQDQSVEVNLEYQNTSMQFYIPEKNIPAFEKSLNKLSKTLGVDENEK